MKRLLTFLGAISLTVVAGATVVACGIKQDSVDYDLLVGQNIDKSKAIDDSNYEGLFTNFYTLGDSLSDTGGLTLALTQQLNLLKTTIVNDQELLDQIISFLPEDIAPLVEMFLPIIKDMNIKVQFGNESANAQCLGAFTNGATAAQNLANKLGIYFKAGIGLDKFGNDLSVHGNNYSVGGATANTADGIMGVVVNDFKIADQAKTLIQQHQVKSTDLVYFEIGGNDLFGMIGKSQQEQKILMNESMANIKKGLLTLINNGVKNIIVMNAPDVSKIPTYVNTDSEDEAHRLSMEFNKRFETVFEYVNNKFDVNMEVYDLASRFDQILSDFEKDGKNITDATVTLGQAGVDENGEEIPAFGLEIEDEIILTLNATKNPGITDTSNYFFWDAIHPNKEVHEIVGEDLFELAEKLSKKQ
ncbi:SGNH/GDSL hydrolase family protein [[Acholeplasma] multilocale]|uniref:SGNH/GDSL hydrolase family protein n=1 Tax=[Acholeplasma] multilocale TaxID=264638 RepID=UPI000479BF85|nr:SGNH/GDSL hydrolase family protein [[Acholeplasma] multilocale]